MSKDIRQPSDLVGEEISAVCFVRDYVEFHFDGPILRSLSNPSVLVHGVEHRFPEPGWRDALCCIIGSTVRAVKLEEQQALKVTTTDDCEITILLDARSLRGPEAMHFVPQPNGPIQVWQSGRNWGTHPCRFAAFLAPAANLHHGLASA